MLSPPAPLTPALFTGGATRNPVDAIRYLSAHATGRTAIALARAVKTTHDVHFLGSTEACLRAGDALSTEVYGGTRDLMARMEAWARAHPAGVIVHSAAVGDYEAAEATASKIPSGQAEILLRLVPAPKILDAVRGWAPDCLLVSFKAGRPGLAPEELEAIARAQLRRTGSDHVFANVLGELATSVLLVSASTTRRFPAREDAIRALAEMLSAESPSRRGAR